MTLDAYDRTLDPPDDAEVCEVHGLERPCHECRARKEELDRDAMLDDLIERIRRA